MATRRATIGSTTSTSSHLAFDAGEEGMVFLSKFHLVWCVKVGLIDLSLFIASYFTLSIHIMRDINSGDDNLVHAYKNEMIIYTTRFTFSPQFLNVLHFIKN